MSDKRENLKFYWLTLEGYSEPQPIRWQIDHWDLPFGTSEEDILSINETLLTPDSLSNAEKEIEELKQQLAECSWRARNN